MSLDEKMNAVWADRGEPSYLFVANGAAPPQISVPATLTRIARLLDTTSPEHQQSDDPQEYALSLLRSLISDDTQQFSPESFESKMVDRVIRLVEHGTFASVQTSRMYLSALMRERAASAALRYAHPSHSV